MQEELDISNLWYIDKSFIRGNVSKLLQEHDIIMSTANSKELVGKSCYVYHIHEQTTFGGFVMVIRARCINSEYLLYILKSLFVAGYFSKICTQTTNIANINSKTLGEIEILLPPLNEQSKICICINKLVESINKISEAL